MSTFLSRYRLLTVNALLVLAVCGTFWSRRIEGATFTGGDFFRDLKLPYQGWKQKDFQLSTDEREMLQPDSVIVRQYFAPDGYNFAELAVIAGHQKRTVHTPGFCLAGDGWQLLDQRRYALPLPNGPVEANRALMSQEGRQVLVTYFFTDGEFATSNLVRFQGEQLLKRFRSNFPLGALVRIRVPVMTTPEVAGKQADQFARATLPTVLKRLRAQRMH